MRFVYRKPSADLDWQEVESIEKSILGGNFDISKEKLSNVQTRYSETDFPYWYFEIMKLRLLAETNDLEGFDNIASRIDDYAVSSEQLVLKTGLAIEKANSERVKGNFNEASELLESCFNLINSYERFYPYHTPVHRARALNLRGKICNKTGKFTQAVDSLENSIQYYDDLNNNDAKAEVFNDIGISHAQLGQFDSSLNYLGKALEIYNNLGNDIQVLKIANNTALINRNVGNMEQAKEDFEKALEISRKLNIANLKGTILLNLGLTISDMGQATQAIEYYLEALDILMETGHQPSIASVKMNLANSYQALGNFDLALKTLEEALEIFEEIGDKEKLMVAYTSMGELVSNKGQKARAFDLVKKGLTYGEEIGNPDSLIYTYHIVIKIAIELNRMDDAEKYLEKLEQTASEAENRLAPQLYKLSKATILLQSDRVVKRAEAQQLLQEIADDEIINVDYTIDALLSLGDLLLQELKISGSDEALNEFKALINRLDRVTREGETTQVKTPIIVQVSMLQSKLALIDLKMEEAQVILNDAYDLARSQGLEILAKQVDEEREAVKNDLLKYKKMVETNASLYERLQQTQITDYLKRAEGILKKK